jgi:hypothetical protein
MIRKNVDCDTYVNLDFYSAVEVLWMIRIL